MNRGFHAFFRQYYNLRDLLRRIDPAAGDADSRSTTIRWSTAQGRRDTFRGLPHTPPLNALAFALRSPTFRLRDLVRLNARAAAPLAAVSVPGIYERLDHRRRRQLPACHQLPRRRTASGVRGVLPQLLRRARRDLSAAELATMFHIYFLGSSEGLIFDVANANFDVALWNPLREYLESRGARFHTGVSVSRGDHRVRACACTADSGVDFDCDGVVLATDVAGLQRIVDGSPDLGDDDWRARVAATGAPHRRSWCSGCGWTGPCRPTARRSSGRAGGRRWTMSACSTATNGKRRRGPAAPAAPSSSCTPTR